MLVNLAKKCKDEQIIIMKEFKDNLMYELDYSTF